MFLLVAFEITQGNSAMMIHCVYTSGLWPQLFKSFLNAAQFGQSSSPFYTINIP